jgi:hypothetical protein
MIIAELVDDVPLELADPLRVLQRRPPLRMAPPLEPPAPPPAPLRRRRRAVGARQITVASFAARLERLLHRLQLTSGGGA